MSRIEAAPTRSFLASARVERNAFCACACASLRGSRAGASVVEAEKFRAPTALCPTARRSDLADKAT